MRRLHVLGQPAPRPPEWRVVLVGVLLAVGVWAPLNALLARLGPVSAVLSLVVACAFAGGTVGARAERPLRATAWISALVAAAATATAWSVAERFGTRSLGVGLALWGGAISGGLAGLWLRRRGRIR